MKNDDKDKNNNNNLRMLITRIKVKSNNKKVRGIVTTKMNPH